MTLIIVSGIVLCVLIISSAVVIAANKRVEVTSLKNHIEFLENHVERHSNCRKIADDTIARLYKTMKGSK